jgi:hypothetical protein
MPARVATKQVKNLLAAGVTLIVAVRFKDNLR